MSPSKRRRVEEVLPDSPSQQARTGAEDRPSLMISPPNFSDRGSSPDQHRGNAEDRSLTGGITATPWYMREVDDSLDLRSLQLEILLPNFDKRTCKFRQRGNLTPGSGGRWSCVVS